SDVSEAWGDLARAAASAASSGATTRTLDSVFGRSAAALARSSTSPQAARATVARAAGLTARMEAGFMNDPLGCGTTVRPAATLIERSPQSWLMGRLR